MTGQEQQPGLHGADGRVQVPSCAAPRCMGACRPLPAGQLTRPPRSTRVSSAATSTADAEPTRAVMRLSSVKGVCAPSLQALGRHSSQQREAPPSSWDNLPTAANLMTWRAAQATRTCSPRRPQHGCWLHLKGTSAAPQPQLLFIHQFHQPAVLLGGELWRRLNALQPGRQQQMRSQGGELGQGWPRGGSCRRVQTQRQRASSQYQGC